MNRRESAWIRIIAWTIVAAVLFLILILGIMGRFHGINIGFGSGYTYADAGKYKAGPGQIDAGQVNELDINWVDGSVKIQVYDGDTVQFQETASIKLKKNKQLHYYNKNGRLMIQYQKSQRSLFSFGNSGNKEVTVKIPKKTADAMGYVGVDTVSGDTWMKGIHAERMNLDTVSGDINIEECSAFKLDMDSTSGELIGRGLDVKDSLETDTTSGNVKIEGNFEAIETDTVSGSVEVISSTCPNKVETDSTSGEVLLVIPENDGFTYKMDSVSGSFRCDFEVSQEEDRGEYKNGNASFRFDSVSGNVSIRKK